MFKHGDTAQRPSCFLRGRNEERMHGLAGVPLTQRPRRTAFDDLRRRGFQMLLSYGGSLACARTRANTLVQAPLRSDASLELWTR